MALNRYIGQIRNAQLGMFQTPVEVIMDNLAYTFYQDLYIFICNNPSLAGLFTAGATVMYLSDKFKLKDKLDEAIDNTMNKLADKLPDNPLLIALLVPTSLDEFKYKNQRRPS